MIVFCVGNLAVGLIKDEIKLAEIREMERIEGDGITGGCMLASLDEKGKYSEEYLPEDYIAEKAENVGGFVKCSIWTAEEEAKYGVAYGPFGEVIELPTTVIWTIYHTTISLTDRATGTLIAKKAFSQQIPEIICTEINSYTYTGDTNLRTSEMEIQAWVSEVWANHLESSAN